jgi:hypothetical protein
VPILTAPPVDGIRADDPGFQRAVDERLAAELARRSLPVLALDAGDSDGWLDVVEAACRPLVAPAQLDLL